MSDRRLYRKRRRKFEDGAGIGGIACILIGISLLVFALMSSSPDRSSQLAKSCEGAFRGRALLLPCAVAEPARHS
jgi:hypothetical protein